MAIEELMQQYYELCQEEREVREQKAMLSKKIAVEMTKKGIKRYDAPLFSVSTVLRKKWKYSEDVEILEGALKSQKKKEQEDGTAELEYGEMNETITIRVK